ncbi:MAG: YdcF family protein [Rhodospirillaceae bacterium]
MYNIIKEFVLPPGNLWLLLLAGFVLLCLRKRTAGLGVIGAGLVAFYLLATPVVAGRLNALVQTVPALSDAAARDSSAQAIVVLSAGLHLNSAEYGGPTVDETTLERLRYGARLHRLTGAPILVSGGQPPGVTVTLAGAMKESLEKDFGISDVLTEDRSLDTHENAVFSAETLSRSGVHKILLVTHASHMPRAAQAFSNAGLEVVPAPTIFAHVSADSPTNFIPRLSGLRDSHYAFYEGTGRLWYWLRH